MPPEITAGIRIMNSFIVAMIASFAVVYWLARRWYTKRNGRQRERSYANRLHLIISCAFSGLCFIGSLVVNAFQNLFEPSIYAIFLLFYTVYIAISVHMWKKASDNPDDHRYERFIQGGALIIMTAGLTGMELAFQYV